MNTRTDTDREIDTITAMVPPAGIQRFGGV